MTYCIKYLAADGPWFFQRLGMWCDTFRDATQFDTAAEAEAAAEAARARLTRHEPGVPGQIASPKLKIVATKSH